MRFYVTTLAGIPDAVMQLPQRAAAGDRANGFGQRDSRGDRRNGRDRRVLGDDHRCDRGGAGLQPVRVGGRGGLDRFRVGLLQHPGNPAGNGHGRAGGHRRCRRHRSAGGDADQRGDRRARGDRYPQRQLPGEHPGAGRGDRGDPAVLRGADDGISGRSRSAPPPSTARGPVSTTTTSTRSCARPTCCGRRSKSSWSR